MTGSHPKRRAFVTARSRSVSRIGPAGASSATRAPAASRGGNRIKKSKMSVKRVGTRNAIVMRAGKSDRRKRLGRNTRSRYGRNATMADQDTNTSEQNTQGIQADPAATDAPTNDSAPPA